MSDRYGAVSGAEGLVSAESHASADAGHNAEYGTPSVAEPARNMGSSPRRCAYCPDGATHTVISASGKQVDTCLADTRRAIEGLLTPPRVLSLAHEPEEAVIVDWSWPPLDQHYTDEAIETQA